MVQQRFCHKGDAHYLRARQGNKIRKLRGETGLYKRFPLRGLSCPLWIKKKDDRGNQYCGIVGKYW